MVTLVNGMKGTEKSTAIEAFCFMPSCLPCCWAQQCSVGLWSIVHRWGGVNREHANSLEICLSMQQEEIYPKGSWLDVIVAVLLPVSMGRLMIRGVYSWPSHLSKDNLGKFRQLSLTWQWLHRLYPTEESSQYALGWSNFSGWPWQAVNQNVCHF